MTKSRTFPTPEPHWPTRTDRRAADSLAAAIRKPLDALDAAAEAAASGMLGGAKLGLLVAANCLRDALDAVDAEFARQYADRTVGRPERPAAGCRMPDAVRPKRPMTGRYVHRGVEAIAMSPRASALALCDRASPSSHAQS